MALERLGYDVITEEGALIMAVGEDTPAEPQPEAPPAEPEPELDGWAEFEQDLSAFLDGNWTKTIQPRRGTAA